MYRLKMPLEKVAEVRRLNRALLNKLSLPSLDHDGDKEARGQVFVVGGSRGMPGAAMLAATAALRAGAGKLLMACPEEVAEAVALLMPEACVLSVRQAKSGALDETCLSEAGGTRSVLIGPGMRGGKQLTDFIKAVSRLNPDCLVLDAEALCGINDLQEVLDQGRVVLTPHAGEFAKMVRKPKSHVQENAEELAQDFSREKNAVLVLKGATTLIATPDGQLFEYRGKNAGLATSGSGDTLSGVIAGLAARGADPLRAALWGVAAHARAGDLLAKEVGPVGFLAREIPARIPKSLEQLSSRR